MFSCLYYPSREDLLYVHRYLKIEINKFCPSGFPSLQTKPHIIIKCHFLFILADSECTHSYSWLEGISEGFCCCRHCRRCLLGLNLIFVTLDIFPHLFLYHGMFYTLNICKMEGLDTSLASHSEDLPSGE